MAVHSCGSFFLKKQLLALPDERLTVNLWRSADRTRDHISRMKSRNMSDTLRTRRQTKGLEHVEMENYAHFPHTAVTDDCKYFRCDPN